MVKQIIAADGQCPVEDSKKEDQPGGEADDKGRSQALSLEGDQQGNQADPSQTIKVEPGEARNEEHRAETGENEILPANVQPHAVANLVTRLRQGTDDPHRARERPTPVRNQESLSF